MSRHRKKSKKTWKKVVIWVLSTLIAIVAIVLGAYAYVSKSIYVPTPNRSDIFDTKEEEKQAQYIEEQGIFQILLVGLDGRKENDVSRTDSMIMATINTNTKSIKLTSFMRDMYVPIPGHGNNKLNVSYAIGGPELLMKTLNNAFMLNIQYYVSINFQSFQKLVDKLGGVEVEVKGYEVNEINKYIKEANWNDPDYIDGAGYQKLNGEQALSYCRIRKVGNNDYERTERQRKVLALLVDKARSVNIFKLSDLFKTLLPYIKTNMPATKLMNIGYTTYKFGDTEIENLRIPANGMFKETYVNSMAVLLPDLEDNALLLESFINSKGSVDPQNIPGYMANNFHENDKAIDKRGKDTVYATIKVPTPTKKPTKIPTNKPTPTVTPTKDPTSTPTPTPTNKPTNTTTEVPTETPTNPPTATKEPTIAPTEEPTIAPTPDSKPPEVTQSETTTLQQEDTAN